MFQDGGVRVGKSKMEKNLVVSPSTRGFTSRSTSNSIIIKTNTSIRMFRDGKEE